MKMKAVRFMMLVGLTVSALAFPVYADESKTEETSVVAQETESEISEDNSEENEEESEEAENESEEEESESEALIAEPEENNLGVDGDVAINKDNFPDDEFRKVILEKYDPNKDKILSTDEIKNITEIDCSNKYYIYDLTGIEYFTELKKLNCRVNAISKMDLSNNTKLTYLDCYLNALKSLDVSNSPDLKVLIFSRNYQITSIDLSKNTALEELEYEENNNLSDLDVSKLTNLKVLNCSSTGTANLNLSANTSLKVLKCCGESYLPRLTSIDLSNNTELEELYLNGNAIKRLNLSNNKKLKILNVSGMNPEDFSISNNTELEELYCNSMALDELNVSGNSKLLRLECSENQLKSLDLSGNTRLQSLSCGNNHLTEIILEKNTELKELLCYNNELKNLDVNRNTKLEDLRCSSNQLSTLNLNNNTELRVLRCDSNQLTGLDLKRNSKLSSLYCESNPLETLDLRHNKNLVKAYCANENCIVNISKLDTLVYAFQNGTQYSDGEGKKVAYYKDPEIKDPEYNGHYFGYHTSSQIITDGKDSVLYAFNDVPNSAWFVDAVQYAYDSNIMNGKSETTFAPNAALKREEFTQILYSHKGKPAVSIENPFADVENGKWYTESILWAKENGIASGKGKDASGKEIFGLGQKISREELALMLYRYAQLQKYDLSSTPGAADGFADSSKVSPWSKEALEWAITQGIISGKGAKSAPKSEYRIDPQGNATRAECATMVMKLFEKNK
ncbi:MAG: S-layer homology domain-containing protein [Lachnospiraceae bacterium]|nr:S-layer homology domain-containing protein [Lachnospiraceae bacterium]